MICRSILAKLRSISLLASGGISTPNLESSNWSLKKLVEGGSNPNINFEANVAPPSTPTPSPVSEDETKRKAKVTAKKVQKKTRAQGTSQLATKKPAQGGLKGINTPQGVNTGTTPPTK
jgi:hypothetical protein